MFIVVKIKCVNFGRISDICDKVNFTTNYIHFTTSDNILSKYTHNILLKHTNIIIFDTFDGDGPPAGGDLRISPQLL